MNPEPVYFAPTSIDAVVWSLARPCCPDCHHHLDEPGDVTYTEQYEACWSSSAFGESVEYSSATIQSTAVCSHCGTELNYQDVNAQG